MRRLVTILGLSLTTAAPCMAADAPLVRYEGAPTAVTVTRTGVDARDDDHRAWSMDAGYLLEADMESPFSWRVTWRPLRASYTGRPPVEAWAALIPMPATVRTLDDLSPMKLLNGDALLQAAKRQPPGQFPDSSAVQILTRRLHRSAGRDPAPMFFQELTLLSRIQSTPLVDGRSTAFANPVRQPGRSVMYLQETTTVEKPPSDPFWTVRWRYAYGPTPVAAKPGALWRTPQTPVLEQTQDCRFQVDDGGFIRAADCDVHSRLDDAARTDRREHVHITLTPV